MDAVNPVMCGCGVLSWKLINKGINHPEFIFYQLIMLQIFGVEYFAIRFQS